MAISRLVCACALALTLPIVPACAGQNAIVHDLEEWEANEIIVMLDSKGIPAEKLIQEGRVVSWSVVVPGNLAAEAMRLVVGNKLPRPRASTLDKVYGPGTGGMIPTKTEEKAKFLLAMHGEIERKLMSLPGIVVARVTVVQPDKDVVRDLDQAPPPATASVAIVYTPVDDHGKASVTPEQVQALVAASVEELKPEKVVVVMTRNAPTAVLDVERPGANGAVAAAVSTPFFGVKVADGRSAERLQLVLAALGSAAVLGLILGVVGIVRSYLLRGRVRKAEAQVTSMTKARREGTQAG